MQEGNENNGPIEPTSALVVAEQQKEKTALFIGDSTSAQRYLQAIGEYRGMLPRATKPTDWVSFGDPNVPEKCYVYLQEYAASQISRLLMTKFGYTIKIQEPVIVSYPGNPMPFGIERIIDGIAHLEIVVQGSAAIIDNATDRSEIITPIYGSTTTADPFFTKKHGEIIDPASVPLGNLLKKAVANYKGNVYREIWGLRGFTLKDLADCKLDISQVHDSTRRSAGGNATPEEKNEKQELWKRILRAHDDKPDLARKFLKSMTSYPAKPGQYEANEGYEDINRLYLKTKDGKSDSIAYKKIKEALDNLEKAQGIAGEDKSTSQAPAQGAAGHGKKKLDYIARLSACKNSDQVLNLEQEIAKDKTLSQDDIEDIQGRVSRKFDEFVAANDKQKGKL